MGKLLFSAISFLIVASVVWYYLPEEFRKQAVNYIENSSSRGSGEISGTAAQTETKQPTREEMTAEIKQNFEAIKSAAVNLEPEKRKEISEMLGRSEDLLRNLSAEVPAPTTLTDRALDLLLPSKAQECLAK